MSGREEYVMSLAGIDPATKSDEELMELLNKILDKGIHGICFSPYLEGQEPGEVISRKQIEERMDIIKPHAGWIRSFSCTDGNELIPRIAHEKGLKTLVGAWLGKDEAINEKEISNLIKLAKEGYADIVAVGNEVLYRKDLTRAELLQYINRVKKELPGIPVGYVDAYYEFENCPEITEACDVILSNCYPFWEGCSLEYSLLYMKDMFNRATRAGKGKKVIITETGWPSAGEKFYGSQPSFRNAMIYFINAQRWSAEDDIEMFYFSSFDESWKTGGEGDVGAYWGIWDSNGILKFSK